MLPNGAGARRFLPPQSVSGHGVRDGRHVVVGSAPPEPRLLRIASQPLGSLGQTVCLPGLVWRNGASTLALMLRSIAGEASTDVPQSHSLRCVSKHEEGRTGSSSSFKKMPIWTRLALSVAIALTTAATASAATKSRKIAVPRSRAQTQTIVSRPAPFSNPYGAEATGGGNPGYNQRIHY